MDNVFVDKYGGSSVASPDHDLKVIENIARAKERGENIVVFSSAKGSITEKPKITKRLSALCTSILSEGIHVQDAIGLAAQILHEHHDDADAHQLDPPFDVAIDLYASVRDMTNKRTGGSPQELHSLTDRIEGIGERLKVRQLASLGQKYGLNTVACDAWDVGFITDDNFRNAKVPESQYDTIKKSLEGLLVEGKIPIVTGFIGKTADGRHTTGGYNSSDLWATIAGAALGAKEIRIYNAEIHAMCSINPGIADLVGVTPRKLKQITYEEADELALQGAKLHPSAIKPARKRGVPVRVLNAFDESNPSTRGTLIGKTGEYNGHNPCAFTSKNVKLVNVHLSEMDSAFGYAAIVYTALAEMAINAEMGDASSNTAVRVAFDANASVGDIVHALDKKGIKNGHVTFTEDVVQIYCVGYGIGKRLNRLLTRVHRALEHAGIEPIMIGSGASASTYGLIVPKEDEIRALRAVHNEFYTE